MKKYAIKRFYQKEGKRPQLTGTYYDTEKEAQEHCQREDTKGDGWFDGYTDKF